jgi:hypothetical protein
VDRQLTMGAWATLRMALTGSNLIHPHHLEFGTTAAPLQLGATGVESGRIAFFEVQSRF